MPKYLLTFKFFGRRDKTVRIEALSLTNAVDKMDPVAQKIFDSQDYGDIDSCMATLADPPKFQPLDPPLKLTPQQYKPREEPEINISEVPF
jgi:hypothetical protein